MYTCTGGGVALVAYTRVHGGVSATCYSMHISAGGVYERRSISGSCVCSVQGHCVHYERNGEVVAETLTLGGGGC